MTCDQRGVFKGTHGGGGIRDFSVPCYPVAHNNTGYGEHNNLLF